MSLSATTGAGDTLTVVGCTFIGNQAWALIGAAPARQRGQLSSILSETRLRPTPFARVNALARRGARCTRSQSVVVTAARRHRRLAWRSLPSRVVPRRGR